MQQEHNHHVADKDAQDQIPGIRHGRLGKNQQRCKGCQHDDVEQHNNLEFCHPFAANDVFRLVKAEKGNDKGQKKHSVKMNFVHMDKVRHQVQDPIKNQQGKKNAASQADQVGDKGQRILQLFSC